jgi:hypothetical protein
VLTHQIPEPLLTDAQAQVVILEEAQVEPLVQRADRLQYLPPDQQTEAD